MADLHWSDAAEIGFQLNEAHPEVDPLTLRFTELHALVMQLAGFADAPEASSEARLEAILSAWLDERE